MEPIEDLEQGKMNVKNTCIETEFSCLSIGFT